uniref:Uncharacterized protein n=1 Tax=Solanum tuberosum TaxID=4113 RepID=M1DC34_SOLTU
MGLPVQVSSLTFMERCHRPTDSKVHYKLVWKGATSLPIRGFNNQQYNHLYKKMMHKPYQFKDRILTFKQLGGEWIHEAWARFKLLLIRCPTYEILDIVFLDCFYRSLGPRNKALVDRLTLGGNTHQPYAMAVHLLDHMAEANQEVEKDFILAALMTQMDELAKKIVEIEVQCKRKDKYIPPHERRKPKDNEGKCVEGMLLIILDKIHLAAREPYGSCDASSISDTKQGVSK